MLGPHGYGLVNDVGIESFYHFCFTMRLLFVIHGLKSKTFISRHGSTPSQSNGVA